MLKAEKKIVGQENKSPWSPILHDAVRTVSIWRTLLKQFKTKCLTNHNSNSFYNQ